jgi:hypothetical protein
MSAFARCCKNSGTDFKNQCPAIQIWAVEFKSGVSQGTIKLRNLTAENAEVVIGSNFECRGELPALSMSHDGVED